ncbi:MAG: flagellar basal body P-ring protein FlgI, partial [Planctomycetes bacterium]|nr:flagellar basal body P-ring protein FlgI [Planctomycetota bacterium]
MMRIILITLITCLLLVVYGCTPEAPLPLERPDLPATFQGTVGSYCELTGYDPVRVQCFSLVVGLDNTGSSECPPSARTFMIKQIRRLRDGGMLPRKYDDFTAAEILTGRDTAVVEVTGLVPAGAPRGARFDVEVMVASGTQTTSLQRGWLIPSELRVVVGRATGGQLVRNPTAIASGPIFINPMPISTMTQQRSDRRRGIVLGGGVSTADRVITLSLLRPDFHNAQQIQKRLNNRFEEAGVRVVGEASRERITLRIPPSYRDDYNHFVSLVWALFMQESQGFTDNKLRELQQLAQEPDPDYELIGLSWEAIGRPALGSLELLYSEGEIDEAGFYAAQTAVNLGDNRALNALIKLSQNENHPFQLKAIEVLSSKYTDARVQSRLRSLINHPNSQIKLLAYEGLRKTANLSIKAIPVSGDFKLEMVNSPGENVILIW